MEAPKCKICGEKHYGIECGVALRAAKPASKPPALAVIPKPENPIITALNEVIEYTKKFDRNAYQREYMRKKRAKDKAK